MPIVKSILPYPKTKRKGEKLKDFSSSGRLRPWDKHKKYSLLLSDSYTRLGQTKRAKRVSECGEQLLFERCPKGHEQRLKQANFCYDRLCSMCNWRKSLKMSWQVHRIAHEAVLQENLSFLFLTLTQRNVQGSDLSGEIDFMLKAWNKMTQRKIWRPMVGWVRALEVTHNLETDTYHPHFHVLLGVRPSYFKKDYISQSDFAELWADVMGLDYSPRVDIRKVKSQSSKALIKVAAETAKYMTKAEHYIFEDNPQMTDSTVSILQDALAKRRLIAFGQLFKDIAKELKISDDLDKADLTHIDEDHSTGCKCSVCNSDMVEHLFEYFKVGYYRVIRE